MKSVLFIILTFVPLVFITQSCQWNKSTSAEKDTVTANDTVKKKFSGEKKVYWENGQLKATIEYVEGYREGLNKNYNSFGKLMSVVPYSQNMKNGESKQYYPTGKLHSTINYLNDAKQGVEKWYYENGKLYQESTYKYGKLHGTRTKYYKTGIKMSVASYINGQPGLGLVEYNKDGSRKKQPVIKVEEINMVDLTGEYIINFKLSDDSKNTRFYSGDLTNGKYFNLNLSPIRTKSGEGKTVFNVKQGTILMHTLNVIAKKKTYLNNELVIQKKVNIAVENR